MPLAFQLLHTPPGTKARLGRLLTPHGEVETPAFMPVGTQATVKGLSPNELRETGCQILLANAFHLYLRPGHELIGRLGGLHRFMGWEGPILTDSGGYQLFSMAPLLRVEDEGVRFQSHLDGSPHFLTPEKAVEVQEALGADIIMALDQPLAFPATEDEARDAVERTSRWGRRCREVHRGGNCALFGIVQGGTYRGLRERSAREVVALDFPGYAVGGLSLGEAKSLTYELLDHTTDLLPEGAPRYAMGLGTPEDLVRCALRGADLFDCVIPTRHARTGCLYTRGGRLMIKHARFREDERPLDPACSCYTCRHFSRAYLRHLFLSDEMLGLRLNTVHNLHYYQELLARLRRAVGEGRLGPFLEGFEAEARAQAVDNGEGFC
ncbi:MAG: tRNA guanosine(34) transglycosylase Tgt [Nitrospinota bacterium]